MARPPVLVAPSGSDNVGTNSSKICVSGPCGAEYYIRVHKFDKANPGMTIDITTTMGGTAAVDPLPLDQCVKITVYCTTPYDNSWDEGIGCADVYYDAAGETEIIVGIVSVDGDTQTQVIGAKLPITRISAPVLPRCPTCGSSESSKPRINVTHIYN